MSLSQEHRETLRAYLDAIDLVTSGIWPAVEAQMQEMGIEDPETALEEARQALQD